MISRSPTRAAHRSVHSSVSASSRVSLVNPARLFGSVAGRSGLCYTSANGGVSWDDLIAQNEQALGPELVANGGFDTGLSGWVAASGGWAWEGGKAKLTSNGSLQELFTPVLEVGRTYFVSFSVQSDSTAIALARNAGVIASAVNGYATAVFTADKPHLAFKRLSGNPIATLDDVSVREIDLSKCQLFSDSAGTVPVLYPIGAGQGLGLLLDRSKGLERGPDLVVNGGFDADLSGWVPSTGWTWEGGKAILTGNNTPQDISQSNVMTVGRWYEISFDVQTTGGAIGFENAAHSVIHSGSSGPVCVIVMADTPNLRFKRVTGTVNGWIDNVSVRELPGNHMQQPTAAARGKFTRQYNLWTGTAVLATQNASTIAAQYRMYFTGAGSITLSGSATGTYSAGSHLITCTAGTLTATVSGSVLTGDLRPESDAIPSIPAYQRVTSATDYDEVGFPTRHRAVTDDWAKAHVNPAGATQAYMWWAGQKMSDATAIHLEGSANAGTNAGTVAAVQVSGSGIQGRSGGSIPGIAATVPNTAPSRIVFREVADIAGDSVAVYGNGVLASVNSADQGTGTYTEQDVFINARAGTSLFANVYTSAPPMLMFLQPGDSLSDSQIRQIDKRFAKAVGVSV